MEIVLSSDKSPGTFVKAPWRLGSQIHSLASEWVSDPGQRLEPYSLHRVLCQDKTFKSEQGLRGSDKKCTQGLSVPLIGDVVWVSSTSLSHGPSAVRPKQLLMYKGSQETEAGDSGAL